MIPVEEKIYKLIGTRQNPTSDRYKVIKELNIYLSICKKIDTIEDFSKFMQEFAQKYPSIESISFLIEKERNENFYISDIDFCDYNGINTLDMGTINDMEYYLQDEMVNHQNLLKYLHSEGCEYFTVKKDFHKEITSLIISAQHLEIYEKIENFEKNKLESTIAPTDKKSPTLKV